MERDSRVAKEFEVRAEFLERRARQRLGHLRRQSRNRLGLDGLLEAASANKQDKIPLDVIQRQLPLSGVGWRFLVTGRERFEIPAELHEVLLRLGAQRLIGNTGERTRGLGQMLWRRRRCLRGPGRLAENTHPEQREAA